MAPEIDAEKMAVYKRTARERLARERQELVARREAAWAGALKAARYLKEKWGASRVMLFGSVAQEGPFHADSDIDLAAEGIDAGDYFAAWAGLDHLDIPFDIDLVRWESARPEMRESIAQGVEV